MFEGLEAIPWDQLEHAYGPASDIPCQIRALASGNDAAIENAIGGFQETLNHQGTVYSATAPAVPFLLEALPVLPARHQASLLHLLGRMAQGHGMYEAHRVLPMVREFMEKNLADPEAALAAERGYVRGTALAVFAQWDLFEGLLAAQDAQVREAVLFVLAVLARNDASLPASPEESASYLGVRPDDTRAGAWAARLRHRADVALQNPLAPDERAAWLSALLRMGEDGHPALQIEATRNASPPELDVILTSCARRALAREEGLPAHAVPVLADLARRSGELGDAARENLLVLLSWLPDAAVDELSDLCLSLLASLPASRRARHAGTVLRLLLGHERPVIPTGPCRLPVGRRELAAALLAAPANPEDVQWFWHPNNEQASAACEAAGVPHDRDAWAQWLQRVPP